MYHGPTLVCTGFLLEEAGEISGCTRCKRSAITTVATDNTDNADTATCSRCGKSYKAGAVHICPLADPSTLSEDKLIGTTIDNRYTVERRLGEGGMGVVYRARHVTLRKPVAIKVLRKAQEESAWKRFIQEAQTASMINHTNVVDLTDFGLIEGHPYLVMEFLEGENLTDTINAGPIAPVRVCRVGTQIARGLQAVHDKGIVHRDLKPDNIFLVEREGKRDVVKIVDFGLAKLSEGQRLTQDGTVVGTAEYISPEQVTGRDTDVRSDQYSLGCILYEMLTSRLPFDGPTTTDVIYKHVYKQPIPPRRVRPEANIPEALEQVIARCMAKKPANRFENMAEVEQALSAIEQAVFAGSDVKVNLPPPRNRLAKQIVVALAVALLLLLLGATFWLAARSGPVAPVVPTVVDLSTAPQPKNADAGANTPQKPVGPDGGLPISSDPVAPSQTKPKTVVPPKTESVQVKLTISPRKALATVECDGETRKCMPSCVCVIPADAGCQVTAPGFLPKTVLAEQAQGKRSLRVELKKVKR